MDAYKTLPLKNLTPEEESTWTKLVFRLVRLGSYDTASAMDEADRLILGLRTRQDSE